MNTLLRYGFGTALLLALGLVSALPRRASAGAGNVATNYGLHPEDAGTAGAFAPFAPTFAAAYFNPAALAGPTSNELSLTYLFGKPQLKIDGRVDLSEATNMITLGAKINLTELTTLEFPINLGLGLAIDDWFTDILTVRDSVDPDGQFFRYGRSPMLLFTSVGAEPLDWLAVGGGIALSVKADAALNLETTLGGTTSDEVIAIKGKNQVAPIVGILFYPGKLLNKSEAAQAPPPSPDEVAEQGIEGREGGIAPGDESDLLGTVSDYLEPLTVALSYRGESNFIADIDASADATVGGSPLATVPVVVSALDGHTPHQISFGLRYRFPLQITAAAVLDLSFWNHLESEIRKHSSPKDQADLDFDNTFTPKFGVAWDGLNELLGTTAHLDRLGVRAGYAFEPSPLKTTRSPDVNLIDLDRHIFALGASAQVHHVPGLTYPVSVSLAYQFHYLPSRNFTLSQISGAPPDQQVTAEGFVNALAVVATVRY